MRRTLVTIPLTALALAAWLTPLALAQDRLARGSITAVGPNSITLKSGDTSTTYIVDTTTDVIVHGGSTAARTAAREGRSGPRLAELLKAGDAVEVKYDDKNGARRALVVRGIDSAAAGGPAARASAANTLEGTRNGIVQSLSGQSLTITGATGGGTFTQTFTIDGQTKVIAAGAGTAAAARGGKVPATEIVGPGDRVSVKYHPVGDSLHAAEIRVTEKTKK